MQPEITIQNRLSLSQAGKLVGKSPSCIFRWIKDGIAGERLQGAFYGGALFTSEDSLNDFARRAADAKFGAQRERWAAQSAARTANREPAESGL